MKTTINTAAFYVVANVAASALGFLRNILFMRTLDHGDIGKIAMLQMIVVIVGFVQLGVLNGGYRLYAGSDTSSSAQINNTIMSSLGGVGVILLPAVWMLQSLGGMSIPNVEHETMMIGCVIGMTTLGATWVNNMLIAQSKLGTSSLVNLFASAISLLVVLLPVSDKLSMALLALVLQPMCVLVLTLIAHPSSRPHFAIDIKLIRKIVETGFAPYCAAIVALTNIQIERWFIVAELGSEAMGIYYLTVVYWTIFTLIPISLLNLFYPKTVKAFEKRDKEYFNRLTRKHLMALIAYLGPAALATYLLLPFTLEHYLSTYAGQQTLVYLSLPGLVAYVLFDHVVLVLQSAKKMLNIFLFTLIALVLNAIALAWATKYETLTLEMAATYKSLSFVVAAIVIAADLYFRRKKLLAWQ